MMHALMISTLLSLAGPADAAATAKPAPSKGDRLPAEPGSATETPGPSPFETPASTATTAASSAEATSTAPDSAPPPDATAPVTAPTAEAPTAAAEPAPEQPEATPAVPPPSTTSPGTSVGLTKSTQRGPDRPITWRLDFGVGFGATRVRDDAILAFDPDRSLTGFDVGARFDYRLGRRFLIGVGAQYHRFETGRDPYEGLLSTDVTVHEPTLRARATLMPIEGIDLFAELAGGPTFVLDRIQTARQAADRRRTTTGTFSALGGLSLYLPKKWLRRRGASRVTGGLETAVGYQFRGSIDMATDPSLGEDPLRTIAADYGDVAMRGFVWRLGFFVRVM